MQPFYVYNNNYTTSVKCLLQNVLIYICVATALPLFPAIIKYQPLVLYGSESLYSLFHAIHCHDPVFSLLDCALHHHKFLNLCCSLPNLNPVILMYPSLSRLTFYFPYCVHHVPNPFLGYLFLDLSPVFFSLNLPSICLSVLSISASKFK